MRSPIVVKILCLVLSWFRPYLVFLCTFGLRPSKRTFTQVPYNARVSLWPEKLPLHVFTETLPTFNRENMTQSLFELLVSAPFIEHVLKEKPHSSINTESLVDRSYPEEKNFCHLRQFEFSFRILREIVPRFLVGSQACERPELVLTHCTMWFRRQLSLLSRSNNKEGFWLEKRPRPACYRPSMMKRNWDVMMLGGRVSNKWPSSFLLTEEECQERALRKVVGWERVPQSRWIKLIPKFLICCQSTQHFCLINVLNKFKVSNELRKMQTTLANRPSVQFTEEADKHGWLYFEDIVLWKFGHEVNKMFPLWNPE